MPISCPAARPATRPAALAATLALAFASSLVATAASAATPAELDTQCRTALSQLESSNPAAAKIARLAKGEIIFPNIVKAGFVFGAAYGEGELIEGGRLNGYYNSITGSWGLQAGAQSYGYIVFLMTDKAIRYVHQTKGFEIGVGPTVVVVNQGVAKNISSSTLRDDEYAFVFDQQGLMAGISIEGTKVSRIQK